MSRNYGRVKTSIWADDDFRSLTDSAQALYLRLLSSPTMSLCGVCDWRPKRLAMLTKGMTVRKVEDAARELSEANYIVVDDETDEVLVRTFVRHESVIQNPKTAAGCETAFVSVISWKIRATVANEMRKLRDEIPDLKGWDLVPIAIRFDSDSLSDSQSDSLSDRVPVPPEPLTRDIDTRDLNRETVANATAPRAEVVELCNRLADHIEANGSKRPVVTASWLNACRLMIDKDGVPPENIRACIDWCQGDEFWRANVLSMPTLRDKYAQLRLQAARKQSLGQPRHDAGHDFTAAMARAQARDAQKGLTA